MRQMIWRGGLWALAFSIFVPVKSFPAEAAPADRLSKLEAAVAALQAENRGLRERVSKLELRLQAPAPGQPTPALNPGWEDKASWRGLRRGMAAKEVEALLGPPAKVEIGGLTGYWFYSPAGGVLGPHVKFTPSDMTVYGWQEP
jgi:hypothetical protein